MSIELNTVETRILGCLLEKERTTPESYPLSLLALTTACNQTTNRSRSPPSTMRTVEEGLTVCARKSWRQWSGARRAGAEISAQFLDHYDSIGPRWR
jgi:uncharacterized protein YceH (UPF0502 family)